MNKTNYTICFNVKNVRKFRDLLDECGESLTTDGTLFRGAEVTGMGWEDSMTVLDEIRNYCEENDIFLPERLL
jgi:hypothetical protein